MPANRLTSTSKSRQKLWGRSYPKRQTPEALISSHTTDQRFLFFLKRLQSQSCLLKWTLGRFIKALRCSMAWLADAEGKNASADAHPTAHADTGALPGYADMIPV